MNLRSRIAALAIIAIAHGSAAGVAAQSEESSAAAPVEFTGELAFGDCPGPLTTEILPGKIEYRGARYCLPVVVEPFSDPRLQGTYYIWPYHDEYTGGPTIWVQGFTFTNDDGAWRGIPVVSLDDVSFDSSPGETHVLIGDGAYEGLTAIATITFTGSGWAWHGWIIDGEIPPMPDPPEAAD
jgi:hypothetical protein